MNPASVINMLPIALLAAVCGLDVVSFPQAMISRPIVAATLGGAMAGNAGVGLLVGAAVELIALETLPVGASRYPEWGTASVVAGALAAAAPNHPAHILASGVLVALATAWVGSWTMFALRRWNADRARRHLEELDTGRAARIVSLQLWGLTADLARAGGLALVALFVFQPVVTFSARHWGVDPRTSRTIVVATAAAVALAAVWKLFHLTPGSRWLFAGGLLLGTALLTWR
jgi:PTS system mannose-specific IIC component